MDPNAILRLAAILACPIVMGLMMWQMSKGMGNEKHPMPQNQTPAERLAALRAQQQATEAEIAELTRIAELESKRDALQLSTVKNAQNPITENANSPTR